MIGWKEWCALPDLGLPAVRAKIDTGARTSALHAFDMEFFKKRGQNYIRFKIHPLTTDKKLVRSCEAQLIQERTIISSNGEKEKRPVILTDIQMDGKTFTTELTLTARHGMNFRMLLGRKALRAGRFTVDPMRSFLMGKQDNVEDLY